MDELEFVEQLNNHNYFTETELSELVQNYEIERIFESEPKRWNIPVKSIVQIKDKFYAIYWDKAATEMQEDYFYEQTPKEVHHIIHKKVVTEWIEI